MEKHKQTRPYFWHQRTRATAKASVSRRLTLETLEDRLVLSAVLPYSQLGVTASGNFPGGEATDAFDGTGLVSPDLHNNLWNEGWLSDGGTPVGEWLKVDLGGTYDIDYLRVWNDNQAGLTNSRNQASRYLRSAFRPRQQPQRLVAVLRPPSAGHW